jgi:hypothetical protein
MLALVLFLLALAGVLAQGQAQADVAPGARARGLPVKPLGEMEAAPRSAIAAQAQAAGLSENSTEAILLAQAAAAAARAAASSAGAPNITTSSNATTDAGGAGPPPPPPRRPPIIPRFAAHTPLEHYALPLMLSPTVALRTGDIITLQSRADLTFVQRKCCFPGTTLEALTLGSGIQA